MRVVNVRLVGEHENIALFVAICDCSVNSVQTNDEISNGFKSIGLLEVSSLA